MKKLNYTITITITSQQLHLQCLALKLLVALNNKDTNKIKELYEIIQHEDKKIGCELMQSYQQLISAAEECKEPGLWAVEQQKINKLTLQKM